MFERFDWDQYPRQLKQFEALKQTGLVQEYLTQFEALAHGILMYNQAYDDVYFVTRFVAGLKSEIRTAIALHRPSDVSTTSILALLQEEELNAALGKFFGREFTKGTGKIGNQAKKLQDNEKWKPRTKADEKLKELKQYRRKNGLCFKCGNKWAHNHHCLDQIPLHVVEELLDALGTSAEEEEPDEDRQEAEESVMALNSPTPDPATRRKPFKLLASIGNQKVLVLVDSGSIGTFISETLVQQLKLPTQDCAQQQYKTADRGILKCCKTVPSLQ